MEKNTVSRMDLPPMKSRGAIEKFFTLVKAGNQEMLKAHLDSHDIGVSHLDSSGKTPLYHALTNQCVDTAALILERGVDVNEMNYVAYHRDNQLNSCFESPIITATRLGDLEMIELLIRHGANVSQHTEIRKREDLVYCDKTALHLACEDKRLDIVQVLLNNNAQVNLSDKSGELPIHKVVRCRDCAKQYEMLKLLCEHGSEVNFASKIECTPLYLATFYGCFKKVELLLSYGADCNQLGMRDNSYGTSLHIVAAKDRIDLAQLLIEHDADLNIENTLGCSPLQLNINMLGRSEIAQLLTYHGADLNVIDKWKMTIMGSIIRNMRLDCESLARLFVYAGYNLKNDLWLKPADLRSSIECEAIPDIPIPHGRVQKLCDWLWHCQCTPQPLVDICRIHIRQALSRARKGRSIVKHIQVLPLPSALKDFLLLKEFMH